MPASEREFLDSLHSSNRILEGKRALIVDDDMRNIFALATLLDEQGMVIVSANNGRDAIKKVESDAEIDVVLMDIMMPEMDGITTIKEIRKLPKGGDLPIIAVTAKAMKGDREKCIEAGRVGLPVQAGRPAASAGGAARLAAPLKTGSGPLFGPTRDADCKKKNATS